MKSWRDEASPWGQRLHFEPDEFEVMMDDLRQRSGPESFTEGHGVDVDLVLLRGLELEADYADLPPGVLGRTMFAADGKPHIEISRELDEAALADRLARRRRRTTLAHEAGHAACHPLLFLEDTATFSLFPQDNDHPKRPAILCRAEVIGRFGYQGEWWEYQANQCMAALLLPRTLFRPRAGRTLQAHDVATFEQALREDAALDVVRELSDQFDVSQEAVFYRLKALGFVPNTAQHALVFEE